MKYFLIILLELISFLSPAQDVIIPADVARYYLEQDDRVNILSKKDSINQAMIISINDELLVQQLMINSYRQDSMIYKSIIENKDQQISLAKGELADAQKIISTQRFEVALFAGASCGSVIGSVVPAMGTIMGTVVGAGIGSVIYVSKRIIYKFKHK